MEFQAFWWNSRHFDTEFGQFHRTNVMDKNISREIRYSRLMTGMPILPKLSCLIGVPNLVYALNWFYLFQPNYTMKAMLCPPVVLLQCAKCQPFSENKAHWHHRISINWTVVCVDAYGVTDSIKWDLSPSSISREMTNGHRTYLTSLTAMCAGNWPKWERSRL